MNTVFQITSDDIKNIVENFYAKVQVDPILGPIFENEMSESWECHLEKMNNFWATVMLGKILYHGNPILVHRKIDGLNSEHFEHWLELFKSTLIETLNNDSKVQAFYQKANNMSRVLKTICK